MTAVTDKRPLSEAEAWWMVVLLALLYATSYVDRFILALLIVPVTEDLGVSDAQMGLLVGGAFSVLYAVLAFPAAAYLDRRSRKWGVFGGVMLWSSMTMASAFATDFTYLQVCRAGVALGEAVLTPAALSIIADCFPSHKRAMPTAVYVSVSSIMGTGTYLLGAGALDLAAALSSSLEMAPWRICLLLVGAPGIAIGLVFALTTREPPRIAKAHHEGGTGLGAFLKTHSAFFLTYYIGVGVMVAAGLAAIIWTPTILVREHGFEVSRAGFLYGLVALPASVCGVYFWSWFSQVLDRRGILDAPVLISVTGALIALPLAVLGPLSPRSDLFLVAAALAPFGIAAVPPMASLVVQAVGTSSNRATLAALYLLSTSIVGLGGGSVAVPLVAEWFEGSPRPLGHALSAFSFAAYLLPALVLLTIRKQYKALRATT